MKIFYHENTKLRKHEKENHSELKRFTVQHVQRRYLRRASVFDSFSFSESGIFPMSVKAATKCLF
jgi:hypothetical protein